MLENCGFPPCGAVVREICPAVGYVAFHVGILSEIVSGVVSRLCKISLFLVLGLALAPKMSGNVAAVSALPLADANPLRMPDVGSLALKVNSPTLLELTLITTEEPGASQVARWDFVQNSSLQLSLANQVTVRIENEFATVRSMGFKRRPLYAPGKKRNLRVANWLYLELATAVRDGQNIEVTNPDGQLGSTSEHSSATMDERRHSPAVHVNQVGYNPSFPKKAMVGYYLGSLGELRVPEDSSFRILDRTGQTMFQGTLRRRFAGKQHRQCVVLSKLGFARTLGAHRTG